MEYTFDVYPNAKCYQIFWAVKDLDGVIVLLNEYIIKVNVHLRGVYPNAKGG